MSGRTGLGGGDGLTFLLICDEWLSTTGGISRYNRSLAVALAAARHRVLCLVLSATGAEIEDAAGHGVELVTAVRTPAGPTLYAPSRSVIEARPDVVVGHDLVSGSAACVYAREYLEDATFVFVVHTAHAQNESYKRPKEAALHIERSEREVRETAARADVVAAVGPMLARRVQAVVGDGFDGVPVLRLDPGMDIPADSAARRRHVPMNATVAFIGRAGRVEAKGLDIAARAVARLVARPGTAEPELLVRGAAPGQCDTLRRQLVTMSGLARHQIDVRPFTDDPTELARDFRRSALCLLPSRVEPLGLSALEAIGHGTPVLVTSRSGLAEVLRLHLGPMAEPMIVEVRDDESDVPRWADAIQRALDDLDGRFTYTHDIRDRLSRAMTWEATVNSLLSGIKAKL